MAAKSSKKTAYIVQPFWRDGKGLLAGQAKRIEDEQKALREGELMASRNAGVTVTAFEYDTACDYWGEPVLIATHGDVPEA